MDIQVIGPDGRLRTPVCDDDGKLVVTGIAGGGGGGAGDASAANQATQIAQIGEVQSSPTANTVLDRLKTLATLIGEVQTSPTSNTLLDRVKGLATLLAGGLPAALTSGGGVKTGLVDALPAGTNAIGKLTALPGLDIPAHDYVACSYTGSDLTGVVYKTGGSSGTTVATLTLAYTDGKLTSVTKS